MYGILYDWETEWYVKIHSTFFRDIQGDTVLIGHYTIPNC